MDGETPDPLHRIDSQDSTLKACMVDSQDLLRNKIQRIRNCENGTPRCLRHTNTSKKTVFFITNFKRNIIMFPLPIVRGRPTPPAEYDINHAQPDNRHRILWYLPPHDLLAHKGNPTNEWWIRAIMIYSENCHAILGCETVYLYRFKWWNYDITFMKCQKICSLASLACNHLKLESWDLGKGRTAPPPPLMITFAPRFPFVFLHCVYIPLYSWSHSHRYHI